MKCDENEGNMSLHQHIPSVMNNLLSKLKPDRLKLAINCCSDIRTAQPAYHFL